MRSLPLCFLLVIVCACSQSVNVTQPPTTPTSHIVTDTIDFGTDPLWREADTTVWINLASHNAITWLNISDSNFTLLDTLRINDSLRISLRFQPQSLANHSGTCLLISKQDTLARLALLGNASPFERRVGDSYIMIDASGKIDSIWIARFPLTISTSNTADIDLMLRDVTVDSIGDWLSQMLHILTVSNRGGGTKSTSGSPGIDGYQYFEQSWSSIVADTGQYGQTRLTYSLIEVDYQYQHGYISSSKDELRGSYVPSIGFFSCVTYSVHGQQGTQSHDSTMTLKLLRLHLRR